jgi:outer membrane protein
MQDFDKPCESPRATGAAPAPSRRARKLTARLVASALLTVGASSAALALDLIDVWRAAASNDPEFVAARAAHEAGLSRREQAAALWRPNVRLESGASRSAGDSSTRGAMFSAPGIGSTAAVGFDTSITGGTGTRVALAVRQPLINLERDALSRQLEISADIAELEWQGAQQALMLRSAERYFDVALASEQLRLLTGLETAAERALVEAQQRFRVGERPVTDTHEAGARAASLRSQRLAAETHLELTRVALSDLTGLRTDGVPMQLPATTPRSAEVGMLVDWLATADRHNPSLRVAEARLREAEQERRKTSRAISPTLELVAQIGRERLSGRGHFGDASNTSNLRAIGVQLELPLYTGGWRSARQAEAQALVGKANADLSRARQEIARQTHAAWFDLTVGSSQESALAAAVKANLSRLDATRVGVRVGSRTTQELLDAENDAATAELGLIQARVKLLTSRLQLYSLGGQLNDAHLSRVNAMLRAEK